MLKTAFKVNIKVHGEAQSCFICKSNRFGFVLAGVNDLMWCFQSSYETCLFTDRLSDVSLVN